MIHVLLNIYASTDLLDLWISGSSKSAEAYEEILNSTRMG